MHVDYIHLGHLKLTVKYRLEYGAKYEVFCTIFQTMTHKIYSGLFCIRIRPLKHLFLRDTCSSSSLILPLVGAL